MSVNYQMLVAKPQFQNDDASNWQSGNSFASRLRKKGIQIVELIYGDNLVLWWTNNSDASQNDGHFAILPSHFLRSSLGNNPSSKQTPQIFGLLPYPCCACMELLFKCSWWSKNCIMGLSDSSRWCWRIQSFSRWCHSSFRRNQRGKGVYEDDKQFPREVKGEKFFTKIEGKSPFLSWQPMFQAFTWARRVQTRHHNGMCCT